MTTPPGNADPNLNLLLPGYDPVGGNANVAVRVSNVKTDATTGIVYGDFALGGTDTLDLGKLENSNWTQGDAGVVILAARNDAFANFTTGDGKYTFVVADQNGIQSAYSYGPINPGTGEHLTNATGVFHNPYPRGASPITSSSGNVANATATATLAGASGKTTYITGFQVSGAGATLGLPVIVTVVGLISGTNSYIYSAVAGVLLENTPLFIQFDPPVPASATNTSIVVSCPALGAGNTNNVVNAQGYQL